MCAKPFRAGNFNVWRALVCPECRPEYRNIRQRISRAEKRIKRLQAELEKATQLRNAETDRWAALHRVHNFTDL
jgi:hypothetical protein